MTRHLVLDEIIDPGDARVLVERDERGRVRSARFALAGLPRVDAMLVGQSAAEVPALVERLCGICPAAHHLAGIRALEAVAGVAPTPTAVAVRRLLHHGSIVAAHAARALATDRDDAFTLLQFGRAATAAAGSASHCRTRLEHTRSKPGWLRVGSFADIRISPSCRSSRCPR